MNALLREIRSTMAVRLDSAAEAGIAVEEAFIREWVSKFATILDTDGTCSPHDLEQLVRELEASYNVHVGNWSSLEDDGDHVRWLDEHNTVTDIWPFWDRYRRYLSREQQLPPAAIKRLDEVTDDILGRLEDPNRMGPWDRRGLVAGQVQSGKTGNYIGLIAKALDSGYKLVVVLAGVHNSLRSQTQERVDEGVLGFDTRNQLRFDQGEDSNLVGVGLLAGDFLHVNSFTSAKEKGDFSLTIARNIGVKVGGSDPIVLVVKKNKSILTNLFRWATALSTDIAGDGKRIVRDVPVLVIDDEADYASVDTNGPKRGQDPAETEPTAINGLIRRFLDRFERSAYVAYTATPFANIFISPDGFNQTVGPDLFPRSFIVNLPAPSTYIGPARVFGLVADQQSSIDAVEALPIVRTVDDYEEWLPDGHRSDYDLTASLPQSLRQAILAFFIAGAVRSLRGQTGRHHSMLIHVTRFTRVQRQVAEQVSQHVEDFRNRLLYGEGGNPSLLNAARELFEHDHQPTTDALLATADVAELADVLPTFEELWRELPRVARKTRVHVVNGKSQDALEYIDHPEGLSVIAIGGDKLSRGLTLEGLSVSYYLRASRMYDTLMQMGRWFGYRAGYLDVCRLFTTSHLVRHYVHITAAAEELQLEFEAMAALGRTPIDFGLRVRQHPDGLLVTSPAKLRHSAVVNISYSGTITETVTFVDAHREKNWVALRDLLLTLGSANAQTNSQCIWRDVAPDVILSFLSSYQADAAAIRAQPRLVADYITSRIADDELIEWTVALADVRGGESVSRRSIGGITFGLTSRTLLGEPGPRYSFKRIGSPLHEIVDLDRGSDRWADSLTATVGAWEQSSRRRKSAIPPSVPGGFFERQSRTSTRGLLLLYPILPQLGGKPLEGFDDAGAVPLVGFAVSLPLSPRSHTVAYQVNRVFWELEYANFGADEDDD